MDLLALDHALTQLRVKGLICVRSCRAGLSGVSVSDARREKEINVSV